MQRKKAKMGRPTIPANERRSVVVCLRVTRQQYRAMQAEAERRGIKSVPEMLALPWRAK